MSWLIAFSYDGAGNLLTVTDPLDQTTTNTYDGYGQLEETTDARDKTTSFTYTAHGELETTTLPSGAETSATYDAVGRVLTVTNALDKTTTTAYDDEGRSITVTDPLGHTTTTQFDAVGNTTSVTDARDHTTSYTYDAAGNRTKVTNASGAETTYTYDALNRLASFADARGKTTSSTYDADGNRTMVSDPLSRNQQATYDLAGNLLSTTDGKNQTTTSTYDVLNRVTRLTKPGNVIVDFTYDALGNTLTTVDARGTTSRTYDDLGQLTSVTTPDAATVAYTYTATGERSSLTYPDDREATYTYTDNGQLATVEGPADDTTTYTYRADGSLQSTALPNGVTSTYTYDDAGRQTSITHTRGATLLAITYTRDENGNPTAIDDSLAGASSYTYDALDQLLSETRGGITTAYTYDLVGNRLSKTVDGTPTAYTYDDANQLTAAGATTYTYDANGSRITRTAGGATTAYTYTTDNLLSTTSSAQTTTSSIYNGENERIAQIENDTRTDFVLDSAAGNELVLTETTGEATTTYTYGLALISRETSAGVRYLLADGLGSVRLETDDQGQVVREHTYEPFGTELGTPDLSGNRFRFTGEHSEAAGLIFLRARVYDPETGSFLSVDPIPTSGSRYRYCENNPLVFVDPSGMIAWSDVTPGLKGFYNYLAGFGTVWVGGLPSPTFWLFAWSLSESRFHGPGLEWSFYIGQGCGGLAAGALWAGLRPGVCAGGAYEEAVAGGRHAGFLNNYANRSTSEIEKAIASLQKQIAEHLAKIANPRSAIPEWDTLDPRQQRALLNSKWLRDMARQLEQIDVLRGILRSRE